MLYWPALPCTTHILPPCPALMSCPHVLTPCPALMSCPHMLPRLKLQKDEHLALLQLLAFSPRP